MGRVIHLSIFQGRIIAPYLLPPHQPQLWSAIHTPPRDSWMVCRGTLFPAPRWISHTITVTSKTFLLPTSTLSQRSVTCRKIQVISAGEGQGEEKGAVSAWQALDMYRYIFQMRLRMPTVWYVRTLSVWQVTVRCQMSKIWLARYRQLILGSFPKNSQRTQRKRSKCHIWHNGILPEYVFRSWLSEPYIKNYAISIRHVYSLACWHVSCSAYSVTVTPLQ